MVHQCNPPTTRQRQVSMELSCTTVPQIPSLVLTPKISVFIRILTFEILMISCGKAKPRSVRRDVLGIVFENALNIQ